MQRRKPQTQSLGPLILALFAWSIQVNASDLALSSESAIVPRHLIWEGESARAAVLTANSTDHPLEILDPDAVLQVKFLNASDGRFANGLSVPIYPATRPSDSIVLRYKFSLPGGFKFGTGGTLPGVLGGADDCPPEVAGFTCWSVQMAWQGDGGGKAIAHIPRGDQNPALQLPGSSLGDGRGVAVKGVPFKWKLDAWNWVMIRIQLNSPGKQDGLLRVEVNKKEVVKVTGLVYRLTSDLGVDAALMEAEHSGPVPRSSGGVASYVMIKTVRMYDTAPTVVSNVTQKIKGGAVENTAKEVVPFFMGRKLLQDGRAEHEEAEQEEDIESVARSAGPSVVVMPAKSPPPGPALVFSKKSPPPPPKNKNKKRPPPPPPKRKKKRRPPPPPLKKTKSPPPNSNTIKTNAPPPPAIVSLPPPVIRSPPPPPQAPVAPPSPLTPLTNFAWKDLTNDQLRRAMALTSIFENANTTLQYGYCENLKDGRGYTFGFAGFTTKYGDGLAVAQTYITLKPENNTLEPYMSALALLSKKNSGNVSTLAGFCDAVAAAGSDPLFRTAQDSIEKTWYYQPSAKWGKKLGISLALIKGQLYDAMINHGEGLGDPFSIDYIVATATQKVGGTPMDGADEKAWFNAFLEARKQVLVDFDDAEAIRRVAWYGKLGELDNWDLDGPIYIELEKRSAGWTIVDLYYGEFEIFEMGSHKLRVIK